MVIIGGAFGTICGNTFSPLPELTIFHGNSDFIGGRGNRNNPHTLIAEFLYPLDMIIYWRDQGLELAIFAVPVQVKEVRLKK